jgi:hypothetical protein
MATVRYLDGMLEVYMFWTKLSLIREATVIGSAGEFQFETRKDGNYCRILVAKSIFQAKGWS